MRKLWEKIFPETFIGFPIEVPREEERQGQRGIAILMAIMIVSIVFTFSSDLVIASRVATENAMRTRDNVKAEFMAKSAFNLGLFLLSMDFGIDIFLGSGKSGMPAQKMTDSLGDIWAKVNGLPIGGGTLEMLSATQESFDLNSLNDDKVISTLKNFDGDFTLNVADEGNKINVNFCATKMAGNQCIASMAMVEALLSCPPEKAFLRNKNVDAKQMAYRIRDYIDSDSKAEAESGMSDENDAYQKNDPPYHAKDGQLDSIEELKMVEGWDDDLHTIFSPYLTAYPFYDGVNNDIRKININTASRELLGCLFPETKADCGEKFELKMKERNADQSELAKDPANIGGIISDQFCSQDPKKKEWFDIRSDVFSITAKGDVGNQTKTISAVIERVMPDKAKKLEKSYALLSWRIN